MATKMNDTKIEKAAESIIYEASSANDFVLDTTEWFFDIAFDLTNKSLNMTSKVVEKGLAISAKQQDMAFGLLNGLKKKICK